MLGDGTLFTRADEVEASWAWISKIHQHWKEQEESAAKTARRRSGSGSAAPEVASYEAGTWGPPAADRLLGADGRQWRRP
jgi:glucose-6-phosphate 1-dehydrogenase